MLENDVAEMNGELVLPADCWPRPEPQEETRVLSRFKADRDEEYKEFLDKCDDFEREVAKEEAANHYTYAELEENDVDLK